MISPPPRLVGAVPPPVVIIYNGRMKRDGSAKYSGGITTKLQREAQQSSKRDGQMRR